MGSYRQLTGMQTPPDRPNAIVPVPEDYEGTNFPYRGVGNHGVEPTPGVDPEAYYDRTSYDMNPDKFESIPAEKEPDPVPVRIVNENARERYNFRTGTMQLLPNADPVELFARNDNRSLVRLRVPGTSSGSFLVSHNRSMAAGMSYTLSPGNEIEFRTTEPIYVVQVTASQAPTIMYLETYTTGL